MPPPPTPAPAAPGRPTLARLVFLAILALAAALRWWRIEHNGWGRQYYAAGVRSMLESWHNFFFNAFDPAGFVSIDKPPLALWAQVASARLLGFSASSMMLPQVIEGVVAVALVHRLVRRRFGEAAAAVAALCLALTPIAVAADRSNNTDSCLVMVLLLAAWAAIRAAETASARRLALAMALVGVGFNVKMAAALVVVPAFGLAWLVGAIALPMRRRVLHLALGAGVLAAVSLAWVAAFDLTPAAERPYAGSTLHNSMLELALLHNGLDRFVRPSRPSVPRLGSDLGAGAEADDRAARPAGAPAALYDRTPTGPLRLATPHLAAQALWWLPLAVAAVAMGGFGAASRRRGGQVATAAPDLVVWTGWAASYAIVFSVAGGVFHAYYLTALAAPLAALAGIGWALAWQRWRDGSSRVALPVALLATAAWQAYISQDQVGGPLGGWPGLLPAASVGILALAAIGLLAAARRRPPESTRPSAALAGLGLLAASATPAAWALSVVLVRPNVAAPVADISALAAVDTPAAQAPARAGSARRLVGFLRAHRRGERFLLAVPNALQAAPLIVRTGEAVMAMGGYLGRDPILTPQALERLVQQGELRFVMLGGYALVAPTTPGEVALADWVRSHGVPVDPDAWREAGGPPRGSSDSRRQAGGPATLYDLRPE